MTLAEYEKMKEETVGTAGVFAKCCGDYLLPIAMEPLEGRNTLKVDRTCIVKCNTCGSTYVSQYD